jgi:hypothetical protein
MLLLLQLVVMVNEGLHPILGSAAAVAAADDDDVEIDAGCTGAAAAAAANTGDALCPGGRKLPAPFLALVPSVAMLCRMMHTAWPDNSSQSCNET